MIPTMTLVLCQRSEVAINDEQTEISLGTSLRRWQYIRSYTQTSTRMKKRVNTQT